MSTTLAMDGRDCYPDVRSVWAENPEMITAALLGDVNACPNLPTNWIVMSPPPRFADSDVSSIILDLRSDPDERSEVAAATVSWSSLQKRMTTDRPRLAKAMHRVMAESLESATNATGGVSRFNSVI